MFLAETLMSASSWSWFMAVLSIVLIDIILAGDNAVVIALAVRHLKPKQRLQGIVLGSAAAVVLRVTLTFMAAQLLMIQFVKLVGGILILWIAIKLLLQDEGGDGHGDHNARGLWQAVWFIMVADITMSLDNVLAVAGASHGSFGLLMFGLALSIPLVVFTSNLLSKLMNKYPIIVYIGAAILGKVGAEMIFTDPWVEARTHIAHWMHYVIMITGAVGVVIAAQTLKRFRKKAA